MTFPQPKGGAVMAMETTFILKISAEDRRLLAEKAEREKLSSAEIVRQAIRKVIQKNETRPVDHAGASRVS
jgi:hypothetical protein